MSNNSVAKVVWVTVLVCLVCSVIVSTAAVSLRPIQEHNKRIDKQESVLEVAGLYSPGEEYVAIEQLFERVDTRILDLDTGEFADIDPEQFSDEQARFAALSDKEDIAGISNRAKYVKVYLLRENGALNKIVVPIYGRGLWSTLYGLIALKGDVNEVSGLKFYKHGETPGLGGEVDNPKWRRLWRGKLLYDQAGEVRLKVIKGKVRADSLDAEYEVDGLSGATLTSHGVSNMIDFWFGRLGYKKFLDKIRTGEIS